MKMKKMYVWNNIYSFKQAENNSKCVKECVKRLKRNKIYIVHFLL